MNKHLQAPEVPEVLVSQYEHTVSMKYFQE